MKWPSLATIDGDPREVSARATRKFSPIFRFDVFCTLQECNGLSVFEVRGVQRGGIKPPRQANIWRCVLVKSEEFFEKRAERTAAAR